MAENDNIDDETGTKPEAPSVTAKDGWKTSQGQMTAIFTLACIVLSFLGFHYTPEQFNDWVDRAEHISSVILPVIAGIVPLMTYIVSRGKVASNTLNANASIKIAALAGPRDPMGLTSAVSGGNIFGDLMGGHDWKDPERYENLLHVAGQFGVPGAAQADAVNQQIHPAQLITGILGMIHKKK